MHNYYTQLYNKLVFEVMQQELGAEQAVLFARSATAGGQQYPVHWGGDCNSTYESMAESLRGGLSLGLSGFAFWSHDIGGFENTAPADVYKRWCAFGLLSSHSRLHGSRSYRVPWLFDDEAVDVLRHFTQLKCRLMPYLYDVAAQACVSGTPVMRAMLLDFADDPATHYLDRQYMLGDSLLVAPVLSESGDVDYYLPAGRWTHLLSGDEVQGGGWRHEHHDFMSLPLYVRPNTLLALGANGERPDYDFAEGCELHLFALDDGALASAEIRNLAGLTVLAVKAQRCGDRLTITLDGAPGRRSLILRNLAAAEAIGDGLEVRATTQGCRMEIPLGCGKLELKVAAGD
jgi:alpha-D-xyloside xylohydrolase